MFDFLSQVFGFNGKRAGRNEAPSRRPLRFRPGVEALEDRAVPALLGSELHINSTTASTQELSATASQPTTNGLTVHAWTDFSAGNADIRAQIYDGFGNKVGKEIVVASSERKEFDPAVAVDAQGNFVVVWTEVRTNGKMQISYQRFSATGAAIWIPLGVTAGSIAHYEPDVAMADNGDFVISFTKDHSYSGSGKNVEARMFAADGDVLGWFIVAHAPRDEHSSSVARTADGRFAIAYQDDYPRADGGVNSNIYLNWYNAAGSLLTIKTIADTATFEEHPDVAMDGDGNAIVVYEYLHRQGTYSDWDIKARKVDKFGAMGTTMTIEDVRGDAINPTVAMDLTLGDGDFVVAYELKEGSWIIADERNASGTLKATHTLGKGKWHASPSIAINGSDVWFVTYPTGPRPDDDDGGIFGWRGTLV